jgi:sirohydrochlorin ferrochelatase
MKSLVIIAHGSKKESSNDEVKKIVENIRKYNTSYLNIEVSFLEFESPSLEDSIKKCVDLKSHKICIYPYFLNSGKHVTFDIPNIVKELKTKYHKTIFLILPHFGKSKSVTNIILSDINKINNSRET